MDDPEDTLAVRKTKVTIIIKDIQITAVSIMWWWGPEWCNKMLFPHFFLKIRYLRNQFEDKDC